MLLVFRCLTKIFFQIDKASQKTSNSTYDLQTKESGDEEESEAEDEYYHEEEDDDASEISTDDES